MSVIFQSVLRFTLIRGETGGAPRPRAELADFMQMQRQTVPDAFARREIFAGGSFRVNCTLYVSRRYQRAREKSRILRES